MLPYKEALGCPCFPDEKTEPQKGQAQQAKVQWEEEGGLSLPEDPDGRPEARVQSLALPFIGWVIPGLTFLTWKMGITKDQPHRARLNEMMWQVVRAQLNHSFNKHSCPGPAQDPRRGIR